MDKKWEITEYFAEVETTKDYKGYFCSAGEALTIVILGSLCGLRNVNQIHQWAVSTKVSEFLMERFGIENIPCYYWLLSLLKIINPASLNECFIKWVQSLIPETTKELTISFDGKTIRSTGKMEKYESPMHIVSAQIAELGITFGQKTVYEKSNEIPAVRDLIKILKIEGFMVVADALNCQKETAQAIVEGKADYLLDVKDNHQSLKEDIADYVQDDDLRKTMDTITTLEKNRGRIERRTAYITDDIEWLYGKEGWSALTSIGAVHAQVTTSKGTTSEWHYYISSRRLTAEGLLKHARLEWSVESMHWLLDVHFCEDFCRIEDKNVQQNLNIVRKIAINSVKRYKEDFAIKSPMSKIMFGCLLDCENLLSLLALDKN